jgi:hypothetical protein
MKRAYKVGARPVAGHEPGASITDKDLPEGVNVDALLAGGLLELDDGKKGSQTTEKQTCPRCVEEGMKRPPKFETQDELAEHYAEKHGGLVVPEIGGGE